MRKFLTIAVVVLDVVVLGVFAKVAVPSALSLYSAHNYYKELVATAEETKKNNAKVDEELAMYQEKYQDVHVSSNFDIAKTVAGLPGAEFISVSSLIDKDGKMFTCSEVTSVDDVNFFNDTTEFMSFELNLVNAREFVPALNSSALTIYKVVVNEKTMKVTLVVATAGQKGVTE